MQGFNRVIILGTLGADCEQRYTQGGQCQVKCRVATSERYKDRDGQRQERTEWHSVTLWGTLAEGLAQYLTKGTHLMVEGSLRTRSWEDKDTGAKRYATEINAQTVKLVGGGSKGDGSGAPRGEQRGQRQEHTEPDQDPSNGGGFDDDLPF